VAKYRAMIEVVLEDDNSEPTEARIIDEAMFQAVDSILEDAGYTLSTFKSIVMFIGENDDQT